MRKRQVSLVIIPVDEITNQVITENTIKPWIEYEREPVWKPGFYVYTDLKQEQFTLHIASKQYIEQNIPLQCVSGKTVIQRIRLMPSMRYPFPDNFTVIRGTGKPGELIGAVHEDSVQQYRLQKDYEPEGLLQILHSEWLDFTGKKVLIQTASERILATLGECQEDPEFAYPIYSDQGQLSKKLRRQETRIFPVFETRVCEDGTFFLPVPYGKMPESSITLWYQGREWKTGIKNTIENRITIGEQGGC